MAHAFRELHVWQQAMDLTTVIYQLTASFPGQERYGLTSQMCRAAVSIPSNVAEGSGRGSKKEFRQFVLIARGSANELETQLLIAQKLCYGDQAHLLEAERRCIEVGRMLNGLARFLKRQITSAKPS